MNDDIATIRDKTIDDFGNQWKIHGELGNDFSSSTQWIENICSGVFDLSKINNKVVLEVGSGSGRILQMLNAYNPGKLIGVEPSNPEITLRRNTGNIPNLEIVNTTGDKFPNADIDHVFSIGVIHHIIDPMDTVENVFRSLKSGGKFIMWVYGRENNLPYLIFFKSLSWLTKRMNDFLLDKFSFLLTALVSLYGIVCYALPFLPLAKYLKEVFMKCEFDKRKYIVFDQLNPAYAKYYRKEECEKLLLDAGFTDLKIKHHHNYSWTVVGTKP